MEAHIDCRGVGERWEKLPSCVGEVYISHQKVYFLFRTTLDAGLTNRCEYHRVIVH